jgi:hypothetical protein
MMLVAQCANIDRFIRAVAYTKSMYETAIRDVFFFLLVANRLGFLVYLGFEH